MFSQEQPWRPPEAGLTALTPRVLSPTRPAGARTWTAGAPDDVLGTLNFLDAAKRAEGAALVRRGASFSLSQSFDEHGPQKGWRRRTNPVHTMLSTGLDAERAGQGFPHGLGGADDVVSMPLQAPRSGTGSATSSTTARRTTAAAPARSSPATATRSPASRPSPAASPAAACCSMSDA